MPRPERLVLRAALGLLARGLLPDALLRAGIRRLCAERLAAEDPGTSEGRRRAVEAFEARLRTSPIAVETNAANTQHYEVPTAFYEAVLGPNLKYSSCLWPEGVDDLADAEEAMLAVSAERARLADGQRVLDLGCGWGSFTLWAAPRFPASRFVAVSNSRTQGERIRREVAARGLRNVEVRTADVNDLSFPPEHFDRIVSIEMLEHVRNHASLFERVAGWLAPDGRLFVHVFCHEHVAYPFEDRDDGDWMARHFFSGGIMPSASLLPRAAAPWLELEEEWAVSGTHYRDTAEAWLAAMDRRRDELFPLFTATWGAGNETLWWSRWRTFFLACAELFGYDDGRQWRVAHYRFRRPPGTPTVRDFGRPSLESGPR